LVVSTVMTAVFCFLYLTKPVFLEAPAMRVNDGGDKVPPGYMIAGDATGREGSGTSPASAMPSELDPGRLSFPEESVAVDPLVAALSQPEPIDLLDVPPAVAPVSEIPVAKEPMIEPLVVARPEPMPVRVSVGSRFDSTEPDLPGSFQPLRVEKARRPLFQSLTQADLARLEARRKTLQAPVIDEAEAPEDAVAAEADVGQSEALVIEGIDTGTDVEAGGGDVIVDRPGDDAVEEPVMRASFIGEFYQDEDEEAVEREKLQTTAMR
jgi:hypothetical protein